MRFQILWIALRRLFKVYASLFEISKARYGLDEKPSMNAGHSSDEKRIAQRDERAPTLKQSLLQSNADQLMLGFGNCDG